jgi:hypothetical protein
VENDGSGSTLNERGFANPVKSNERGVGYAKLCVFVSGVGVGGRGFFRRILHFPPKTRQ